MNRKGMSQTLALIVAAMVLMMTALTLIFMVQGSLGGLFSDSQVQTCVSTIQAKCSIGGSVTAPNSCFTDGRPIKGAPNYIPASSGDLIRCSNVP